MASFPLVTKGEPFSPSVERENAIRRDLSRQNVFLESFTKKTHSTKISVYNTTSLVIKAGTAVAFDKNAKVVVPADEDWDEIIPCKTATASDTVFGILSSDLDEEGDCGSCIVSGPVTVEISGTGDFAAPAEGGKIVAGASGAPILFRFENTAVINLGGGSGAAGASEYNGMHKLVLITDNSNPEAPIYKVCVCDGATYNPQTHTSKSSRVEVNGVSFDLDSQIFELKKQDQYVYVIFTAATEENEPNVKYEIGNELPQNQYNKTKVYLLGRVIFDAERNSYNIQQDHIGIYLNGCVYINWGVSCDAV